MVHNFVQFYIAGLQIVSDVGDLDPRQVLLQCPVLNLIIKQVEAVLSPTECGYDSFPFKNIFLESKEHLIKDPSLVLIINRLEIVNIRHEEYNLCHAVYNVKMVLYPTKYFV